MLSEVLLPRQQEMFYSSGMEFNFGHTGMVHMYQPSFLRATDNVLGQS